MKNFSFLFLFILMLYGCNEKDTLQIKDLDANAEGNSSTESPSNVIETEDNVTQQSKVYEQFNDILVGLLNDYGYLYNEHYFYKFEHETGVLHADLIDFDQDGQEELYVLFQSTDWYESTYNHRQSNSYVQEVWHATNNNEAELIHHTEIPFENCFSCGTTISFNKQKDGKLFIKEYVEFYDEENSDSAIFTTYYHKLNKGQFELETFRYETESDVLSLNDEEISQEQFAETQNSYNQNEQLILESEYGVYQFHIDTSTVAENVSTVLRTLNNNRNSLGNTYNNSITNNYKVIAPYEVQAEFEYILDLETIDVRDTSTHADLLKYVFHKNIVHWESEGYRVFHDETPGFPEEIVARDFEQMFGIPLNMDYVKQLSFSDDWSPYDDILYDDGVIYFEPVAVDLNPIYWRFMQNAYEIGDNIYYGEFIDTEFSQYHEAISGFEEDFGYSVYNYENVPVEAWPEPLRRYVKHNMQRYGIIKIVDGYPAFLYIGYDNLTDEEIEEFSKY